MKVKVDNRLLALEFGRQSVQTDQVRYYYQLAGFEDVILVTHDKSYPELLGEIRVALFDPETTDGTIVCDLFPKAPARWRGRRDLVQVTLREVRKLPSQRAKLFSQVIYEMLGNPEEEE